MRDFDIAVVGSGFGGSLMAMIAQQIGYSVVLLERGQHPRFVIGESSTPLANLLLEELAERYRLPNLKPLAKWGAWRRNYPGISCGLKRGFTFLHHELDQKFASDSQRRNQLLVAASPHDQIADTHWYRPDFDLFFVQEAGRVGVEFIDQCNIEALKIDSDCIRLAGYRQGQSVAIRAKFLIDASGSGGCLQRLLQLKEVKFTHLPATQALFSHFSGVRRLDEMGVVPSDEPLPYPIDDAAVHHIFDGGWIWVLRFNNGITSAGTAVTSALARELRLAEGRDAWQRLLQRLPTVADQFADTEAQLPFVHLARIAVRVEPIIGSRWSLLPSAAGFVDPLLSTGFALTLLGIERLARALERGMESPEFARRLKSYAQGTARELAMTEELVAALYASMSNFPVFTALSLLYFAAASFSETARRLRRPELACGFLLEANPKFGPPVRALCQNVLAGSTKSDQWKGAHTELIDDIYRTIEPFDVAGLCDRSRRNWYPVDADDVIKAAPKLGASTADIADLLKRSGFFR